MKSILFSILIAIVSVVNSQPKPRAPIFLESHVMPADSFFAVYISYRIPYSNLVFVKNGNKYDAGVNVMFEASLDGNIAGRQSSRKSVTTSDYHLTDAPGNFIEGVVEFPLPKGNFEITPSLSDNNSDRSVRLEPISVTIPSIDSLNYVDPIPVYPEMVSCKDNDGYRLVNFEGAIPFSPNEFNLVLIAKDTSVSEIQISITQNKKNIFEGSFSKSKNVSSLIDVCDDQIVFHKNGLSNIAGFFLLDGFTRKLREGPFEIEISNGTNSKKFDLNVVWINKPISLRNIDFALDLTEKIFNNEEIEKIYSYDSDEYDEKLFDFWEDKDPNKSTVFNELMNEFYLRADYAAKKFSTANNSNGVYTDRGLVYLKFGEPDKIERSYPEQNQIIELWIYKKLNKEFYFKDSGGLGNYTLME